MTFVDECGSSDTLYTYLESPPTCLLEVDILIDIAVKFVFERGKCRDTLAGPQMTLYKYEPTLHCCTHYAVEDSLGEETHVVLSYLVFYGVFLTFAIFLRISL